MEKYTRHMTQGEFLFCSRNGTNKPITTLQAYRIIVEAGGTYWTKKHWNTYNEEKPLDTTTTNNIKRCSTITKTIFNHSSPSITLRYIGISQDEIDTSYKNFFIIIKIERNPKYE